MDKKKVYSLIIVLIMFASTIAFAFMSALQGSTGPAADQKVTVNEPVPGLNVDIGEKRYEADLTAKVVAEQPVLIFSAGTDKTEKADIDIIIASIPGVKNISSSFRMTNQAEISTGLVYFAEISFDSGSTTAVDLAEKIFEATKEFMQSPSFGKRAIVEFQKTVSLKIPDVNETKEYTFGEALSGATVSLASMKNDSLQITLFANFNNNLLIGTEAYETKNLDEETKTRGISGTFTVLALSETVDIHGFASYAYEKTQEAIQDEISAKNIDVNYVQQSVGEAREELTLEITLAPAYDTNSLTNDLNSFISTVDGVKNSPSFSKEENFKATFSVDLSKLESIKSAIIAHLASKNISRADVSFIEPDKEVVLRIYLNRKTEQNDFTTLENFFSNTLNNITVFQEVLIDKKALSDENRTFEPAVTEDDKIFVRVAPFVDVNALINVTGTVMTKRDAAIYYNLVGEKA